MSAGDIDIDLPFQAPSSSIGRPALGEPENPVQFLAQPVKLFARKPAPCPHHKPAPPKAAPRFQQGPVPVGAALCVATA
jgi:hypothetical protein